MTEHFGIEYFTMHEQDTDSEFYDDSALDRVTHMEYPEVNGKLDFDHPLIISRTRVMSFRESIS